MFVIINHEANFLHTKSEHINKDLGGILIRHFDSKLCILSLSSLKEIMSIIE